jgi:hypothetical protein
MILLIAARLASLDKLVAVGLLAKADSTIKVVIGDTIPPQRTTNPLINR